VSDRPTVASLYHRYYRHLVRLGERHVQDAHLAEDVAQEALLQALRYFDAYDHTRPVWPWLRTIAVRVAHGQARQAAAERPTDMTTADGEWSAEPDRGDEAESAVLLEAALAAVPARQRAALVVRYVADWATTDAAELFGMEVNAFEQLLWRARKRLATEYRRIVDD
jgi:RNA polymerase sigma-70 factor (ECF subfamily)